MAPYDATRANEATASASSCVRRGDLRVQFGRRDRTRGCTGRRDLLPTARDARELRPLEEPPGAAVVLFRWDCGLAWQGPVGRHDDRGFTVYKMGTDRLSPLVEVLGVEALQHFDAASLGCLNACATLVNSPRLPGARRARTGPSAVARIRSSTPRGQDARAKHPQTGAGGGFPAGSVLNDWERYWVFKARGEFKALDTRAFLLPTNRGKSCATLI